MNRCYDIVCYSNRLVCFLWTLNLKYAFPKCLNCNKECRMLQKHKLKLIWFLKNYSFYMLKLGFLGHYLSNGLFLRMRPIKSHIGEKSTKLLQNWTHDLFLVHPIRYSPWWGKVRLQLLSKKISKCSYFLWMPGLIYHNLNYFWFMFMHPFFIDTEKFKKHT